MCGARIIGAARSMEKATAACAGSFTRDQALAERLWSKTEEIVAGLA